MTSDQAKLEEGQAASPPQAWSGLPAGALLAALPDPVFWLHSGGVLPNAAAEALFSCHLHSLSAHLAPAQDSGWPALLGGIPALTDALPRAEAGETLTLPLTVEGAGFTATLSPAGPSSGQPGGVLLHLRARVLDPLEGALELLDNLNLGLTVQNREARISACQQCSAKNSGPHTGSADGPGFARPTLEGGASGWLAVSGQHPSQHSQLRDRANPA